MIKTATITFQNADNYGAMLQAYALQKAIITTGCSNVIIDYRSSYMNRPWCLEALKIKGLLRYVLGVAYYLVRLLRKKKFDRFRRDYLQVTEPVNKQDLALLGPKYDFFIVGSDQVWNPYITNYDKSYFLDFVEDRQKKCSYAASFGLDELDRDEAATLVDLLGEFHYLTVREAQGQSIISTLINRASEVVLDPCLLICKSDWNDLIGEDAQEDYLLVYQTTFSSYLLETAKIIADRRSLKMVCIPFPMGRILNTKTNFMAGPKEWLTLIKNANCVVTDSFHGSVFSIVFNVDFYVSITEGGSRIINLLNIFNLKRRLFSANDPVDLNSLIEWHEVNNVLEVQQERSLNALRAMLS